MNLKRIDIHINKCLDGLGEEDKIRYEIYRKYNKLTLRETDIYMCCPICNKNFSKIKNPKIKYCHVQFFEEIHFFHHNFYFQFVLNKLLYENYFFFFSL